MGEPGSPAWVISNNVFSIVPSLLQAKEGLMMLLIFLGPASTQVNKLSDNNK